MSILLNCIPLYRHQYILYRYIHIISMALFKFHSGLFNIFKFTQLKKRVVMGWWVDSYEIHMTSDYMRT